MQERVYRSGKSLIDQTSKTHVPENAVALWHLGQSGVLVKANKTICYFDPYLSNYIEDNNLVEPPGLLKRNFDSPMQPKDINNANVVFITHDHLDHLDPETLKGIKKFSPHANFVCPAPSIYRLTGIGVKEDNIYAAKANKKLKVNGLDVIPIPAKHEKFCKDKNGNHYYLGYVVYINGIVFFHAGDTLAYTDLVKYLQPLSVDIACLPINGQDWRRNEQGAMGNMDFRDAVEISQAAGIDLLIPVHYDLFESNTENPAYFIDYLYRNYPGQKCKLMVPGERLLYLSEKG
ncbi:MBL fold metallo-hydrolase [Virgibacillus ihumii]|uniref:MBL fold metallo-hydrolase n=1 Tax=Virgibacillus ihumii TaxID=2686091 RepID=UPI00157DC660|nr:MBL fold metallo-hydrolase [Virgibacillus ihumii]